MSERIAKLTSTVLRGSAIAAPMVLGILLGRWISPYLPAFATWVGSMGFWAPVAFVVAYVVVVVLMLPAFLLIMAGGAVFGMWKGALLSMIGAMLGGVAAFLISRHFARELVARRVARNALLSAIDRSIGENGARLVFLLRLSPAVPFVLSNYALGITRVRLSQFLLGTLGLVPIVLTFAAYGSASGAAPLPDGKSPISPLVLGVGLVATAVLGVLLARITQRALHNATTRPPLPEGTMDHDAAGSFRLSSADIMPDEIVPGHYVYDDNGCEGDNVSPALSWDGAPAETKSFAVTVFDPDAPPPGWWHWQVFDIPASDTALATGAGDASGDGLPGDARHGPNDYGKRGWGGPCPPPGDEPHRYVFTVYALRVAQLDVPDDATADAINDAILVNRIASATFTAIFGR